MNLCKIIDNFYAIFSISCHIKWKIIGFFILANSTFYQHNNKDILHSNFAKSKINNLKSVLEKLSFKVIHGKISEQINVKISFSIHQNNFVKTYESGEARARKGTLAIFVKVFILISD